MPTSSNAGGFGTGRWFAWGSMGLVSCMPRHAASAAPSLPSEYFRGASRGSTVRWSPTVASVSGKAGLGRASQSAHGWRKGPSSGEALLKPVAEYGYRDGDGGGGGHSGERGARPPARRTYLSRQGETSKTTPTGASVPLSLSLSPLPRTCLNWIELQSSSSRSRMPDTSGRASQPQREVPDRQLNEMQCVAGPTHRRCEVAIAARQGNPRGRPGTGSRAHACLTG